LRGRLFFTYALILIGLLSLMALIFASAPGLLEFFLRREITKGIFLFFILFSCVVIGSELFSSAIAGMMNIKVSAIAQSVTRLLPLPKVAFLFFWNRPFLEEHAWALILGIYIISYSIGALISATALIRDKRFELQTRTFIPEGFMSFCLTTHLASIFTFMYHDVDRIFMLQLGELGGLGMYQAVISITRFVDYAPHILGAALVPMFSSLLAGNDSTALKKAYDLIQRYSVITITILSLFVISFSRELLGLFGTEYIDYYHVLSIFGLTGVICSLFLGNTAILTSYEKNFFRLSVSTLQIFIQLFGTFWFINTYGVLAVAGFKAIGRIIANIANIIYVLFMPLNIKISRVYWAGLVSSGISLFCKVFVFSSGFFWSVSLFTATVVLFVLGGQITLLDIQKVYHIVKQRKLQPSVSLDVKK
jgi:O-antigen/teichoic acid export membrane protein